MGVPNFGGRHFWDKWDGVKSTIIFGFTQWTKDYKKHCVMGVGQFGKWELIINYPWVRILHNWVGPFCSSGLNVPRRPSFSGYVGAVIVDLTTNFQWRSAHFLFLTFCHFLKENYRTKPSLRTFPSYSKIPKKTYILS